MNASSSLAYTFTVWPSSTNFKVSKPFEKSAPTVASYLTFPILYSLDSSYVFTTRLNLFPLLGNTRSPLPPTDGNPELPSPSHSYPVLFPNMTSNLSLPARTKNAETLNLASGLYTSTSYTYGSVSFFVYSAW